MSSDKRPDERRAGRQAIASETLKAIEAGSYTLNGVTYGLSKRTKEAEDNTVFFNYNDSILSGWKLSSSSSPSTQRTDTEISILEVSTLAGARHLATGTHPKIGILNFASAKKPGGGFLSGAQAQEESIARSSNLYPTLMTPAAQQFYNLHKTNPRGGFYSHSMIYSPDIVVFRDDHGSWVEPLRVDVLTSPAVNAGLVRKSLVGQFSPLQAEEKIAIAMEERMARILCLFEKRGVGNIVLGSFGTGVFKNKVHVVARIWAELLCSPRFKNSFDRVVFAILGRETFEEFKVTYETAATQPPQQ